ncbi:hypothetical protein H310_10409 [Aphanomyces invadans]|uniref:Uncharacterized protein n=1 Tax=Aphanomyces invadans TaxID=157072 RepID=A0A024TQD6_9STRA|nr:hypothetical protein H310_10409 [Aphanomyces invadans]ETV96219.1 hypothetical protein H310_10409 [Aphanomyces invadans]|eukprot:XP_008875011.1 hypothetical protein H310_10409 [Aphanomyces invadans]
MTVHARLIRSTSAKRLSCFGSIGRCGMLWASSAVNPNLSLREAMKSLQMVVGQNQKLCCFTRRGSTMSTLTHEERLHSKDFSVDGDELYPSRGRIEMASTSSRLLVRGGLEGLPRATDLT